METPCEIAFVGILATTHINIGMKSEELFDVEAGDVVDPLGAVSSEGSIPCREDDSFGPDGLLPKGHFDVIDWNC
jgi:hypothetical protein